VAETSTRSPARTETPEAPPTDADAWCLQDAPAVTAPDADTVARAACLQVALSAAGEALATVARARWVARALAVADELLAAEALAAWRTRAAALADDAAVMSAETPPPAGMTEAEHEQPDTPLTAALAACAHDAETAADDELAAVPDPA